MRHSRFDDLAALILPIAARQDARHYWFPSDGHHGKSPSVAAFPDFILEFSRLRQSFGVPMSAQQIGPIDQIALRILGPSLFQGSPQWLANARLQGVAGGKR